MKFFCKTENVSKSVSSTLRENYYQIQITGVYIPCMYFYYYIVLISSGGKSDFQKAHD